FGRAFLEIANMADGLKALSDRTITKLMSVKSDTLPKKHWLERLYIFALNRIITGVFILQGRILRSVHSRRVLKSADQLGWVQSISKSEEILGSYLDSQIDKTQNREVRGPEEFKFLRKNRGLLSLVPVVLAAVATSVITFIAKYFWQ